MSGRLKVLIAEDDQDTLDALRCDLKDLNFEVLTAADGQQALALVNEQEVDIIMSDFHMPHISGLQLLAALREEGHYMPFIILSGNNLNFIQHELNGLGVFDVLMKPVPFETLRNTLGNASLHCHALASLNNRQRTLCEGACICAQC